VTDRTLPFAVEMGIDASDGPPHPCGRREKGTL